MLMERPLVMLGVFFALGWMVWALPQHSSEAPALKPGFEARWQLSLMRMQQARIPMEGIQLMAKTARLHPEHPEAAVQLGEMAMGTGQYGKAVNWYRWALQQADQEEKSVIQLRLSDAYFAEGKIDSARLALYKVFDISRDSVLLRTVNTRLNELKILSNK